MAGKRFHSTTTRLAAAEVKPRRPDREKAARTHIRLYPLCQPCFAADRVVTAVVAVPAAGGFRSLCGPCSAAGRSG